MDRNQHNNALDSSNALHVNNKNLKRTISIGNEDFKDIIKNNYLYVDKTSFIKDWWNNGDTVTLITRPRRFGRTLTLSMIETFFSIEYKDNKNITWAIKK